MAGPSRLHDGTVVSLHSVDPDQLAPPSADERARVEARDAEGRVVGSASYERVYGPRAVVTLDVDDAYWHRGLPALVLGELGVRAACRGISTFLMRVASSDTRLLALLRERFAAREEPDRRHVDVELSTVMHA